jgi:hypothetical protein
MFGAQGLNQAQTTSKPIRIEFGGALAERVRRRSQGAGGQLCKPGASHALLRSNDGRVRWLQRHLGNAIFPIAGG